jgi:hypothetical protein
LIGRKTIKRFTSMRPRLAAAPMTIYALGTGTLWKAISKCRLIPRFPTNSRARGYHVPYEGTVSSQISTRSTSSWARLGAGKRRDHGEQTLAEIGRSYNVSGWTIARLAILPETYFFELSLRRW